MAIKECHEEKGYPIEAACSMWPVPPIINGSLGNGVAGPQRTSVWLTRLKKSIRKARKRDTGGSMTIYVMTMVSMLMTRECFAFVGPEIYGRM